jgi:hypothetical protein
MRALSQRLGLGRFAYQLYHRPAAAIGESMRAGGPWEQWRTSCGRRRMAAAAYALPPLSLASVGEHPLELHLLTGRRFWYQTAFCLWSFGRQARRPLMPFIYDDGSLTEAWRAPLARIAPSARFITIDDIQTRLDAHLPATRFPTLRQRRLHFPLLRKLTDLHVGSAGWKLFIDSDLLFFRCPTLLVDWLDKPTNPIRAVDVQNAYGYPLELLTELAGQPVAELLNTGLCGLRSEEIDWERMEYWCRTLIERAGTHYYQEQALVALLLAGRDCLVAPSSDYVTLPRSPEVDECRAVMHHYVAESKRWYFRYDWLRAIAVAGQLNGG